MELYSIHLGYSNGVVSLVLSFTLRSLGFLTKLDFEDYENTLTRTLRDAITISLPLHFEGTIIRSQKPRDTHQHQDLVEELIREDVNEHQVRKPDRTFEVLNEIVVDRGLKLTMSATEPFGDEKHLRTITKQHLQDS